MGTRPARGGNARGQLSFDLILTVLFIVMAMTFIQTMSADLAYSQEIISLNLQARQSAEANAFALSAFTTLPHTEGFASRGEMRLADVGSADLELSMRACRVYVNTGNSTQTHSESLQNPVPGEPDIEFDVEVASGEMKTVVVATERTDRSVHRVLESTAYLPENMGIALLDTEGDPQDRFPCGAVVRLSR